MKQSDILVSIICPLRNVENSVEELLNGLWYVANRNFSQFEIIIVDDGSTDQTSMKIVDLCTRFSGLRLVQLSREFGIDVALTAGLDTAIGNIVVSFLHDCDPPDEIPKLAQRCISSGKVIIGQRIHLSEDPTFIRFARSCFYFFCQKILNLEFPRNTTYFVAMNRSAVTHINRTKDKFRFLKAITNHIGLPIELYPYRFRTPATGKPRQFRSFLQSLHLSVDVVVSQSLRPLRLITLTCLMIGLTQIFYLVYILIVYLNKSQVAEGWTTLSAQVALSNFLVLFALATISEYIGRLLEESRDRPLYYITKEHSSTSIHDSQQRNVLNSSTEVIQGTHHA